MKTILRPSGENAFLKDAVRDLVIVVGGILAALWLEAWWQDQQDRDEELNILAGLREEFQANRDDLEQMFVKWNVVLNGMREAHSFMGGPVNDETIAGFLEARERAPIAGGLFYDPRYGQLTSVISSGKLGLIGNPELRALIADWPTLIADHDSDEVALLDHVLGPMYDLQAEYNQGWPDDRFESRIGELMMDRRFDFSLRQVHLLVSIMVREGEQILESTDIIIRMIDLELGDQ